MQWCYIGYRRLSKAMAAHQATHAGDTFDLHWRAFYLNPHSADYPGVNKREMYEGKFGGAARADAIFARLTAAGQSTGINFKFGGNTGRTRDSHRLLYLAGQKYGADVQTRIVEALFRAYFEEEGNITDRAVLLKAAVQAAADSGLTQAEVQRWLDSDEDLAGKEVDREASEATSRFVTGVPHFTIQGKYVIEGGQEPEAFLDVFERVKADGL
jgi:predicted DsbA family dithiol-disulfide isomerase